MPTLTEDLRSGAGHYIVSESNGYRARSVGTIASGAGVLKPGAVLAQVTATKKWVRYNPAGADGSQNAAAILYQGCDATAADVKRTLTARDSEVQASALEWAAGTTDPQKATAIAALAVLGIIAR